MSQQKSIAESIENYYQSLKASKTENSGIRFGQWCTTHGINVPSGILDVPPLFCINSDE